jgi:hypothetical protein
MAAIISIGGFPGGVSNDNLPLGVSCSLFSVDTATTYTWSIVSQPAGPNDSIVGSGQSVSFTPTKEGSYLVRLTVDVGLPSEDSQQLIAAVRELETGDRIPAIGETTENSANDGWANPVDAILERVTRFTEAGVLPGVAGAAGLAVGDVVYASGVYTLAATLPGARVVPSWAKAQANSVAAMQGVFGVLVGSVKGGTIASGDVITVRTTGLYQGVPYGSAPTVGQPVYISNAASLSLTIGTIDRQIGTVCAVHTGTSTYDVMVGPAPAELATTTLYAKTYWVSTSGSDVVGDGSINNPFATPQKAHDVALVAYPTAWVAVEIGPGDYARDLIIEKWNIVFHGAGSRPETQATKLLGYVSVNPDGATQKFNDVVGLDRLYIENTSSPGDPSLAVGGTGAFSLVVTDCYLTTGDATATCAVEVNATNAIRPRVTINDCVLTVQTAGPNIINAVKGDVRISSSQLYFGSTVSSGAAGKGITVANDASLFADRLLLDAQTIGPGIEVTGSYAGAKLTLSNSSVTLTYASCSHGISVTNGSAGQLAAFVWNTLFGVTNGSSKAIYGSGSLGTNIVTAAQLSYLYGTSSGIGSAVTLLGMTGDVAGGDLSGNLPAPTVAKIQGRAVLSTAPASGEVLGWNGSAWAPTSNSAPPSGAAGGVLGYTGSTYPNPSGLAANGSNKIPVKSPGVGTTVTMVVDLESTGAGAGLTLAAGDTVGSFTAGAMTLRGGNGTVSTGTGGVAQLIGGSGTASGGAAVVGGGGGISPGDASLVAGSSTGGGAGGTAYVYGGNGDQGGTVTVRGGAGTAAAGNGGDIVIAGGSSSLADGGDISIDGGIGLTGDGVIGVGVTTAQAVLVGRSGKDVKTYGRNVGVPTTYAPIAATTIPVDGATIFLNPAANRDMTASPTIQTSGITAGTIVTLVNEDSTFYVDLTQDAGGTSYLKLATGNIYLFKYDTITLIFDGTYWVEVGRNVQPGKSYTPVAGTTIPLLCPVVMLTNAGAVDLGTANATIQTTGINAGTRVTFVQKGAGTTTFRRGGSTLLRLSNASHAVAQYGTLELVYDGANWCEVALANNA